MTETPSGKSPHALNDSSFALKSFNPLIHERNGAQEGFFEHHEGFSATRDQGEP